MTALTTRIADLSLRDDLRAFLRRMLPSALTVADLDHVNARLMFLGMVPCNELTAIKRLFAELGLEPIGSSAREREDWRFENVAGNAGCLYVRAELEAVEKAVVAVYENAGFAAIRPTRSAPESIPKLHSKPRRTWDPDTVIIKEAQSFSDWIAVASHVWELSYPRENLLAKELSNAFPVLALTTVPSSFTEVSVYDGGAATRTQLRDPRGAFADLGLGAPLDNDDVARIFGCTVEDLPGEVGELTPFHFDVRSYIKNLSELFDTASSDDCPDALWGFKKKRAAPKPKPVDR